LVSSEPNTELNEDLGLTWIAEPRFIVNGFARGREIDPLRRIEVLVRVIFDKYGLDVLPIDVLRFHDFEGSTNKQKRKWKLELEI
jgi:hypothetical protein